MDHYLRQEKECILAKPNYSFQKRQKELARQKKQEEKKQRKLEKAAMPDEVQERVSGEIIQEERPSAAPEPGS